MKLSERLLLLLLLICLNLFPVNQVYAQEVIGEEALFEFEEYVVSASKRLQRIEEAPATITVITAEDIRQSGLANIPDILRQVAGLDVIRITAFDTQVAIRGFLGRAVNTNVFNKVLVLLNGRSVYEDFFGGIIWELLPIQLEDIERIEVVKGPGSVLYGANAFAGIINIITKSPDESGGGLVSVTDGWFNGSGQINHNVRSLIYGGKVKDLSYRVSGGWESASRLEEHNEDAEKVGRVWGLCNYEISESSGASLEAGISDGEGEIFAIFPGVLSGFQMNHVKANYNYSNLKAQAFWRGGRIELPVSGFFRSSDPTINIFLSGLDKEIDGEYNTYDIELQHSINLAEIHTILGGLNYRFVTMESNFAEEKGLNTYAGFLQYEVKPISSLIFNLGVRVDRQDYIGTNVSPRGSLIFTPLDGHNIYFSVGRAFRNPTYIDLFVDVSIGGFKVVEGRQDLETDRIESYELGYRVALFERLKADLEIFYSRIHDLIHTFGEFGGFPARPIRSNNYLGLSEGIGGEAGLEYKITPWLAGFINYSYEEIIDDLVGKPRRRILSNPKNKVNMGLRATLKNGLSGNILFHYVDYTNKEHPTPELPMQYPLDRLGNYFLLNARVAYEFLNHFEVAAAGQNLLNDEHKEVSEAPEIEDIPLMLYGTLSAKF